MEQKMSTRAPSANLTLVCSVDRQEYNEVNHTVILWLSVACPTSTMFAQTLTERRGTIIAVAPCPGDPNNPATNSTCKMLYLPLFISFLPL